MLLLVLRYVPPEAGRQHERKGASFGCAPAAQHLFEDIEGGRLMRNRVQYELAFGILGNAVRKAVVACELERSFDYRARTLEEMFSGSAESA